MHEPGRRRDRTTDVLAGPGFDGAVTTPVQDPAIAIEMPFVDGDVGTPVSVTGTADVVDAALTVRVLD